MKKTVTAMLVLMLLNLCVPGARAEISQDLDPMVSADPQATVTEKTSMSGATTSQTSNGVSAAAATADEKKTEKPKKEKAKKEKAKKKPSKKSTSKKNSKAISENSKADEKSSR
jgi:hypothetical protein